MKYFNLVLEVKNELNVSDRKFEYTYYTEVSFSKILTC